MENKPTEIKDIYQLLGKIEGRLEASEKSTNRITLALIGVIAAQIGVKVLGTPILLDIATIIGIVGIFILLGVLIFSFSAIRRKNEKLTSSGVALVIMVTSILITQILVYFRDLGVISASVIYGVRIAQNISIFYFAWRMMSNPTLHCKKEE